MAGFGIGRTFQNVALFRSMTVRDNVLVGAHHPAAPASSPTRCGLPVVRREAAEAAARRASCWRCSTSSDVADRRGRRLPFGSQKRVEMARALISRPKLLLLDEPAGGLNHGEVDELAELLGASASISTSRSCWSSIT